MKRLPIKMAKDVAEKYDQDQVIILSFNKKTGVTSVVTYGKTKEDCVQAAQGGNKIKRDILKWPEDKCLDVPSRSKWKWKKTDEVITKNTSALMDIFESGDPIWIEYDCVESASTISGFANIELNDDYTYFSVDNINLKDCPKTFRLCGGFEFNPWEDECLDIRIYKCERV